MGAAPRPWHENRLRCARRLLLPGALLVQLVAPVAAAAQTVFEVQGGGSTLFGGYGSLLNFWHPRFDGWMGLGWQDGWRMGAFVRTEFRRDTVRLGNDVVVLRLPTDVFGSGTNVLVQGASLVHVRGGTMYRLFGGASTVGLSAPLFAAARPEHPFGALQVSQEILPDLTGVAHLVAARDHTALAGLEWRPRPGTMTSAVGGMGADRPYGAAAGSFDTRHVDGRISFVGSGRGFQRIAVPIPGQTEVDGLNFNVTVHPRDAFYVGVGRQRFRRDTIGGPSQFASSMNATAGTTVRDLRVMVSVFRSEVDGRPSTSTAAGAGMPFGSRFSAEYYFMAHNGPEVRTRTSLLQLRETVSPRLQLSQHLSYDGHTPRGALGGTVLFPFGTINVDYQLLHIPFDQERPFQQTLTISSSLQLGNYKTSVSSQVNAKGRVAYSATGSTFLYMNEAGGVQPQTVGVSLERFVVRGIVRDDQGNPVEGAAIDVEGQVAYTNIKGEFFVRVPRPRAYRLQVLFDEFLGIETYELVSIPETVEAARAANAVPGIIVLRRRYAPAPGDTTKSPPAPGGAPAR